MVNYVATGNIIYYYDLMEKPSALMAWIGSADVSASLRKSSGLGPIGQALKERNFSHAFLLEARIEREGITNASSGTEYEKWLAGQEYVKEKATALRTFSYVMNSPNDFEAVYGGARKTIQEIEKDFPNGYSLTFHLSAGTPIMAAVWVLLSKTVNPADLIESSVWQEGVRTVNIPFEVTGTPDFILQYKKPESISTPTAFSDIIFECSLMQGLIGEAANVAPYDKLPVLILGESGTGKELFARAIHKDSPRSKAPFIAVNCGSLPRTLLQSELFGYEKGAFTGAVATKLGIFERAHGGTVFLDEIGEMQKDMQVNLLRVLQEKEVTRLGGSVPIKVDIRLIAATNIDIYKAMSKGRFRTDLFWRIAGNILELPSLRERSGDVRKLVDHLLEKIYHEYKDVKGWKKPRTVSSQAMDILCRHEWPGNVRELENTILRVAISTNNEQIGEDEIQNSINRKFRIRNDDENILNRDLGKGFNLRHLLDEVKKHYIYRALDASTGRGRQKKAAELLGEPNHQTFSNWLKQLGIDW